MRRAQVDRGRAMRVLLFSAAPKADEAGVQKVVLDLAAHLRRHGHPVVTAWPDGDATAEDWRLRLEAGVGPSGRPGPVALARACRDAAVLAAQLARFRPDVVNLHYPRGQTLYFDLMRSAFGYRLVLSFHNSDLAEASPAVRNRLPAWLDRAAAVTAVSDDLARSIAALNPDREVTVIPNGIDTDWWTPGPEARDPSLVVAAGRLIEMKGFDLLLEAFAIGAPATARLVIAGAGDAEAELRDQAAGLGLGERVEFPGFLGKEALRALFRRAGLFVLPSRREGMPLVLIEAMATGLPAVAAAVNGVPQVMAPGCGEMIPPGDVAALAAALGRVADPTRLACEGAAARARAEHFGAARSYDLYEAVLAGARSA